MNYLHIRVYVMGRDEMAGKV